MSHEANRILTHLDRPVRIVIFTPTEFLLLLFPIILGVIVGGLAGLLMTTLGFFFRKQVIRLQRTYSKRFIQGFLYWQLPAPKVKGDVRIPHSYVREYVS